MIMCTYKQVCITNRHLTDNLPRQVERAIEMGADIIILREKDLPDDEYRPLAMEIMNICDAKGATCIVHSFWQIAIEIGCKNIHLTIDGARTMPEYAWEHFGIVGVSTHTIEEAIECEKLGVSYVTASPIYHTQCKPDVAARGLEYLSDVVNSVNIPVYALGGISNDNSHECIEAGASGVCMMSEYMRVGDRQYELGSKV